MLEVTAVNFNIKSNELVEINIESGIMLQDFRISQKLFKSFSLGTVTNPDTIN